MSKWYVASNLTPGDNSGIDMVPNPGDYTDLVTGDKCLTEINGLMTIYKYDETEAGAANGSQLIIPDGNVSGTGAWVIEQIVPMGQNGWVEQDNTTLSFVDGTRTFSITPTGASAAYLLNGASYEITAQTDVVIDNEEGAHWIYFDNDGTLKAEAPSGSLTSHDLILSKCLVGNVYWDTTNSAGILKGNERHGCYMSPATHLYLHDVYGGVYEAGLGFSGFSTDGSGNDDSSAQFDLGLGEFYDEDISHPIAGESDVTIPTFYKSGVGGNWRRLESTATFPVADGTVGTQLDWNDYNGGDWRLLEVTSGNLVCTHYFATNDPDTPIVGIMGETVYNNTNQARTGAETEILDITYNGLPLVEWVILGTVIWQTASNWTNQVAARIRTTDDGDDYVDWRQIRSLSSGGGSTNDHEALDNLLGGSAGNHWHLTETRHTALTGGGDTDLHRHDTLNDPSTGNIEVDVTDAGMRLGSANSRVSAVLDEDDMASDSATAIATQQSIKAYVRDNAGDAAVPRIDFYQDWLQETKYQNSTVVTMTVEDTLVSSHDMTYNIENKRYDFTVGEFIISTDLYDSDLSMTDITEAIADLDVTDDAAGTFQISNDGGSTWVTITDTSQVQEFVTSDIDLRLKYTAGGTGYIVHMGVLYNPDTIFAPATEVIVPGDNIIVNGDFDVWQRGTSLPAIAHTDYSADRFIYNTVGSTVATITQDTDVPTQVQSGHLSSYSLKHDTTVIDAAIVPADNVKISQRVEGYNFRPLQGKYATLSFWVKATKIGIYCVAFRNSGNDRSYVSEYTVNTTNTWEKKTITVNFNYSGGTWDYTSGLGLRLSFVIASGSTFHTTADAWQTGNYFATSNQVDGTDNTANNFLLAQVKLEQGQEATPWKSRSFSEELALCQRYYEKSYDIDVDPGTADTNGEISHLYLSASTVDVDLPVRFKVSKRGTPTVVAYDEAGTINTIYKGAAGATARIAKQGTEGCTIGTANATNARRIAFHYTADAEL